MRSALLRDITHCRVVIPKRRYRITTQRRVTTQKNADLVFWRDLQSPGHRRIVIPKRRYRITTLRCVTTQKSADLVFWRDLKSAGQHLNNAL